MQKFQLTLLSASPEKLKNNFKIQLNWLKKLNLNKLLFLLIPLGQAHPHIILEMISCLMRKKEEKKLLSDIFKNKKKLNNKLIVILGPTASGKSNMSIKLAKKFNGEIISADSRQIYKEMNIGTAKIKKKEMEIIPHHLIDIIKPNEEFTLADFKEKVVKIIKDIQKRNKIPFLVGGTGLYIQVIVDNLQIPKVKPDKKLRFKLEKKTNQELYNQLKKIDPQAFKK